MTTSSDRLRDVRALVTEINKELGEDSAIFGAEIGRDLVQRIKSGSLSLDIALGGGWPANQWNEIIGNESTCKTATAMKTVAANQKLDPDWVCLWCDAEGAYDKVWASRLGVDNDRVVVVNTNVAEEVYDAAMKALERRVVDCVVIDSLPALIPAREVAGDMEDFQPGLMAFLTGKFFRMQRPKSKRSLTHDERPVTGIMINQWREKIGIQYGDPRTTPGGKGKNFAYYTRVELSRDEWIQSTSDRKIGLTVKARCIKNKSFPPQRVATYDFYFEDARGFHAGDIDYMKEVVNLGQELGVIERAGKYYRFGEAQYVGKEGLVEGLRDDPDVVQQIEKEVLRLTETPKLLLPAAAAAKVTSPPRRRRVAKKQ